MEAALREVLEETWVTWFWHVWNDKPFLFANNDWLHYPVSLCSIFFHVVDLLFN